MKNICFCFQMHAPYTLKRYRFFEIGQDHYYYDDMQTEDRVEALINDHVQNLSLKAEVPQLEYGGNLVRGINLMWEESIIDYLVKKSYSITYGARNLRRTIQRELEDGIAEKIIESFESPISQIKLLATEEKVEILAL